MIGLSAVQACGAERRTEYHDIRAVTACRDFVHVWHDARTRTLTDDEFVDRVRQVDRNAREAEDSRVRDGARALLAATETGSTADGVAAALKLQSACEFHLAESDSL
jgi:DNA-binding MltR family transcriptional regulator